MQEVLVPSLRPKAIQKQPAPLPAGLESISAGNSATGKEGVLGHFLASSFTAALGSSIPTTFALNNKAVMALIFKHVLTMHFPKI